MDGAPVSLEIDPPVPVIGRHRGAAKSPPARLAGSATTAAAHPAAAGARELIDVSRNPYSRSRPLLSLLRQLLNIIGGFASIFWRSSFSSPENHREKGPGTSAATDSPMDAGPGAQPPSM